MPLTSLARGLVRWRWAVVGVWAVIAVVAAFRAPKTVDLLDLRGGGHRPTEARVADSLLRTRFPRAFSEYFVVTVQGPSGFTRGRPGATLDSLLAASRRPPWVSTVLGWPDARDSLFLGPDQRSTFFLVAVTAPTSDSIAGLVAPFRRALVAALLPILIGVLAIAVSLALIGLLARLTPMSVFVLNLTTMLGLGVGIDYSLLMVTRFREELNHGLRPREAAQRTVVTAGNAVITSGLTVVVGLAALLLTPLVDTRSIGLGGIVVVAVAVLLSVTLLPALLATMGRDIDRPRWLARRLTWYHAPLIWEGWARALVRHPWRALMLGGSAIALLAWPLTRLSIGLPARHWWPATTEAGAAVDQLSAMGRAGYLFPVRLVMEAPEAELMTSAARLRGLRTVADSLLADPRVGAVRSVLDLSPGGGILTLSVLLSDLDSARVQYPALDGYLSPDAHFMLVDVIPADTVSLPTAMGLVRTARALIQSVLLDATVVRMVLVPAFMHLAGRWNWWPGRSKR